MRLACIGSRTWTNYEFIERILRQQQNIYQNGSLVIVSGGAKGADFLAEKAADYLHINKTIFLPDWEKYGKSAGLKRNELIVKDCDAIFAFWDGRSNGTMHTCRLASAAGKPVTIFMKECK